MQGRRRRRCLSLWSGALLILTVGAIPPAHAATPVGASRSAAAVTFAGAADPIDYTPVVPNWRDVSECSSTCYWNHPIQFGLRGYNICYACQCLIQAAETPEEMTSAEAQCEDALGWPK